MAKLIYAAIGSLDGKHGSVIPELLDSGLVS